MDTRINPKYSKDSAATVTRLSCVRIESHAVSRYMDNVPGSRRQTAMQIEQSVIEGVRRQVIFVEPRHNGATMFHVPSLGVDVCCHLTGIMWEITTITPARWKAEPQYAVDVTRRNG